MSKERPILMSAPMVRAILAGSKSQTRRAIKPQPELSPNGVYWHWPHLGGSSYWKAQGTPHADRWTSERIFQQCPYGAAGDHLWIRETFAVYGEFKDGTGYCFRADGDLSGVTWKPSIFMPRALSRITLEITDVRVERVQDISDNDVIAEGAFDPTWTRVDNNVQKSYRSLWDSINGKGAWESNPWVWVVSFQRVPA